jgi:acetoin:2,6-dichlorophenolindophenol oxidoreductase subunit alpha
MPDLPTPPELARMYELMQTITAADERFRAEVRSGALKAAFYPVRGLEGVCAALAVALRPTDYLVSTYRNLGDALAKGVDLTAIVAEAAGRAAGTSKGKGGPMHIQDVDKGLMHTTGVVGSGLPIAAGLALAAQLDGPGPGGDQKVTLVTFGDGATSIGAYHEAMNMAALWKLPLVFLCQNNQWAEHTRLAEYAPVTDLAARATAYGITATAVDGFDPIATWRVLRDAIAHARSNAGPAFVECRTYRLSGHAGATDFSYMPEDEFAAAMARDPGPNFRAWLEAEGHATPAALDGLDAAATSTVENAFAAMAGPPPAPDELYTDVYA